jgi:glycerol kinase
MGAPWWRADARAVVAGITASTTRAHIVRAALDALCFRVRDVVDALPVRPDVLRVDGGMTANSYLVQRQADVLDMPIEVAGMPETTALGAAAAAGVGAGMFTIDDLAELAAGGRRFQPGDARAAGADYLTWRRFAEQASLL